MERPDTHHSQEQPEQALSPESQELERCPTCGHELGLPPPEHQDPRRKLGETAVSPDMAKVKRRRVRVHGQVLVGGEMANSPTTAEELIAQMTKERTLDVEDSQTRDEIASAVKSYVNGRIKAADERTKSLA